MRKLTKINRCYYLSCRNNYRENLKGRCSLEMTYHQGQGVCKSYEPKKGTSGFRMPTWYKPKEITDESKSRVCPLLSSKCIQGLCEWWNIECVILIIEKVFANKIETIISLCTNNNPDFERLERLLHENGIIS